MLRPTSMRHKDRSLSATKTPLWYLLIVGAGSDHEGTSHDSEVVVVALPAVLGGPIERENDRVARLEACSIEVREIDAEATVLCRRIPRILIFDEATSALDYESESSATCARSAPAGPSLSSPTGFRLCGMPIGSLPSRPAAWSRTDSMTN